VKLPDKEYIEVQRREITRLREAILNLLPFEVRAEFVGYRGTTDGECKEWRAGVAKNLMAMADAGSRRVL
jgi:hypothetical protein